MQRTTIMAREELLEQLRRVAHDRKTSMAAVIREALEQKVQAHRPKPRSVGIGDSGHTDTSQRAGQERPKPRSWR